MNKFLMFIVVIAIISCNKTTNKTKSNNNTPPNSVSQTETLLKNLFSLREKGYLFGHQDDTLYGIGWEGDDDRSDVKSVCGDYPALIGFDIGDIELDSTKNLDKVPFDKIRKAIIDQYNRNGLVTISWHANNPATGGNCNSIDANGNSAIASILPNGKNYNTFQQRLSKVAAFLQSLKTENGTAIPIILRPWHEHTGNWFWWGQNSCSKEEYIALWRMTHNYLDSKGLNNIIYAYSPDIRENYMERYPGDEYVDILGLDLYQFGIEGRKNYLEKLHKKLTEIKKLGEKHHKLIALTETGCEGIPDANWWTDTLKPLLDEYPLSYVMVWRNAREKPEHFYVPYPGQDSEADFVSFYNAPNTLFIKNLPKIYDPI
ncbi:MAG: beta-mannosidase [Flavobacteriales bacterium]|nr:MAG: beta-mannosidase [Flavobacteriales bacterium]